MTNAALIGYWKITKMDVWNAAYVDLVVPGFIEFEMEDDHLMGQFQFGTVSGGLDCRVRDVSGESYVEWSGERVSYFARPMYPCVSVSIFHAALRPTR